MTKTKKPFKRIALSLSLIMMMLWIMLGTSTSVAWFSDTSNTLHNIFHIGDFSLVVSYQQENGTYKVIEQNTKVLNDEDLYEPGYVKVQYLKIENKGTQDFNFKTAVQVTGFKKSTNVFGEEFNLKDYIRFGLIFADSEAELDNLTGIPDNRKKAVEKATAYADKTIATLEKQVERYEKELDAKSEEIKRLQARIQELETVTTIIRYDDPEKEYPFPIGTAEPGIEKDSVRV